MIAEKDNYLAVAGIGHIRLWGTAMSNFRYFSCELPLDIHFHVSSWTYGWAEYILCPKNVSFMDIREDLPCICPIVQDFSLNRRKFEERMGEIGHCGAELLYMSKRQVENPKEQITIDK